MIWAYDLGWFVAIDAMKVLFTAGLNLSFPTFGPKGAVWLNVRPSNSQSCLINHFDETPPDVVVLLGGHTTERPRKYVNANLHARAALTPEPFCFPPPSLSVWSAAVACATAAQHLRLL